MDRPKVKDQAHNAEIWVDLVTGDDNEFVACACIPPFIKMPDILVWGIRSFKKIGDYYDKGEFMYAEVTCYCLPACTEIRVGSR